jgi:hypothetical protein
MIPVQVATGLKSAVIRLEKATHSVIPCCVLIQDLKVGVSFAYLLVVLLADLVELI